MGVTLRKDKLYRAYRQISNNVNQQYFTTKAAAVEAQAALDEKARLEAKAAPLVLFSKGGRFFGFNVRSRKKNNSKHTSIFVVMQLYRGRDCYRGQFTYRSFDSLWRWLYSEWVDYNELSTDELIALSKKIKLAKSIYQTDINRLLVEL